VNSKEYEKKGKNTPSSQTYDLDDNSIRDIRRSKRWTQTVEDFKSADKFKNEIKFNY
jgi:hypothetical protein